ncbi:hypothetical protein WJX79_005148 [Trebouxia sp. C0005]
MDDFDDLDFAALDALEASHLASKQNRSSVNPATEAPEQGIPQNGIRVHKSNAKHWVYPASVPERAYQIDIISTALLQNTLVCLPTGLGKTLIAAVIMHNFTRWFPEGKVVFVAPTKPLVNQQIEACYEFMGVSKTSIEELTGSCKRLDRQDLWELPYKQIFFCTPQTFRNDIDRGICPHKKIVCLVVDECHRAKGNSDVVMAVKKLREEKCKFRVLGLSATPGSNNESIQEVIDNLMISAIQYRSETDPDIQPHVHQRCVVERVVQPTREVDYCKQTLIHVLQDVLTSLARMQAYYGHVNAHTCQRFSFLQASDKYKDRPNKNPLAGMVFRQAMVLTDCRDQLDSYGIDTALKYLDGKLTENAIKRLLGENTMFNEFHKQLKSLSIVEMLRAHEPLITARIFIGQASGKVNGVGMKQAEQKKVLTDFRSGAFNTLVATCIGEEGLDIPQVDLIVCFDSDASPIRNIQRMGRTGRHKAGRVVYIMSQGKEEESYRKGLQTSASLQTKLRRGNFQLLERPPRMLPRMFNPLQLNVDCSGKTPMKAAEGKKGRKPRGAKASGESRASRPSSAGGRTGGRGRGSGNRSKQNSAASASHSHSLNNAVSEENSNPGAHVAHTGAAEQEPDTSADPSPSEMGTDDSAILEHDTCVLSPEAATPAGRSRHGGCPSPATAARIMPPPSTGRFLGPAGPAITAQAAPHTGSTPRPPRRKRRGLAAHGLVLMTQESPSSDSPQGNDDNADKGLDREDVPLQARLKRLKRVHNGTAVPPTGPATASAPPATAQGGSSRHGAQHVKPKGLSKQDQRRRVAALIDIEAEASSEEEEESSDEADEDTELPEADAMFVNDASPAAARSQRERRHEDMLAVYNQHLMSSGTPVLKLKGRRFQHTPKADTPRSSASSMYDLEDSFLAEEEDASQDQSDIEVSQHDEACAICHQDDECDMLLCDGCPKVFHLTCLELTNVPPGQWFCAVCNDGNI